MKLSRLCLRSMAALLIGVVAHGAAIAQDIDTLYQAQAIVTGQGEKNRKLGFAECLQDVLVRVSGDQRLLDDPAVLALLPKAGEFVSRFRYRDRLEGIPVHDEQGTHDRPHDLYCSFAPDRIDPLLQSLGRKPWRASRPRLVIFLGVHNDKGSFTLAADGNENPYMQDSFRAAAEPLAMAIVVPTAAALAAEDLDFGRLQRAEMAELDALAPKSGGDIALAGSIVWSHQDLGWVADWRLASAGKTHRWQVRGVSFDEAFRNAMRGAVQILSGNGSPP